MWQLLPSMGQPSWLETIAPCWWRYFTMHIHWLCCLGTIPWPERLWSKSSLGHPYSSQAKSLASSLGCCLLLRYSLGQTYLKNVVFPIFAMYSFDSTDVQATKHLRAGVYPQLVPGRDGKVFWGWGVSSYQAYLLLMISLVPPSLPSHAFLSLSSILPSLQCSLTWTPDWTYVSRLKAGLTYSRWPSLAFPVQSNCSFLGASTSCPVFIFII